MSSILTIIDIYNILIRRMSQLFYCRLMIRIILLRFCHLYRKIRKFVLFKNAVIFIRCSYGFLLRDFILIFLFRVKYFRFLASKVFSQIWTFSTVHRDCHWRNSLCSFSSGRNLLSILHLLLSIAAKPYLFIIWWSK